jgi:hypothetical protein
MVDTLYKTMANVIAKAAIIFNGKTQSKIADYLQNREKEGAKGTSDLITNKDALNDIVSRIEKICSDYNGKDPIEIADDLNSLSAQEFEQLYEDIQLLSKIIPEERREQRYQENGTKLFVSGRAGKWIDAYLSDEISASVLSYLIVLEKLLNNKLPSNVKATINLAIKSLVSKGHLSTKEEQNIKNTLNEVKKAYIDGDDDGVDSAIEKIIDTVTKRRT